MSDWYNLYGQGWGNLIVPDAYAHPAKFSRKLIRHIYKHIIDEGWVSAGDIILDPFGGVALGALHAMENGLNWIGVELESRFVRLGQENIDLWNKQFGTHMPNWGTGRLLEGDSRQLLDIFNGRVAGSVASPPYAQSLKPETLEQTARKQARIAKSKSIYDGRKLECPSPGKAGLSGGYGDTAGQLVSMPESELSATISSPPYTKSDNRKGGSDILRVVKEQTGRNPDLPSAQSYQVTDPYGETDGQLGTIDTFWSAARTIVEQVYSVLCSNAHAVWVVKSFVRKKEVIPFPDQWVQMCESVGFKTVHRHKAWLIEDNGIQKGMFGEDKSYRIERKSFFRRINEAKGSPRIDWEDVVCMVKI